MRNKYPFLFYCFTCFPAITEQSSNEHRSFFKSCVENGYVNIIGVRDDVENFTNRNESWVKMAKESESVFYSLDSLEEDVKIPFQLYTWDLLFPERILSLSDLKELKVKVIAILKSKDNGSINLEDLIWDLEDKYELCNLSKYDLLYMRREVANFEIESEYFAPEFWFFKLISHPA